MSAVMMGPLVCHEYRDGPRAGVTASSLSSVTRLTTGCPGSRSRSPRVACVGNFGDLDIRDPYPGVAITGRTRVRNGVHEFVVDAVDGALHRGVAAQRQ